jgi:hypothetical protein
VSLARSLDRLVANHHAAAVNATDPMLSSATARSSSFYDHSGAWNDNDFSAVRTASAFGSAMKASTAAPLYLDDHAVRTLAGGKRRSLRGTCRYPKNESKCDKSVHSFSPCISVATQDHGPGDLTP